MYWRIHEASFTSGKPKTLLSVYKITIASIYSISCGAAVRTKPKARLCEPWVTHQQLFESCGAAKESLPEIFLFELYAMALE
jgi:hypothetical protein